MASDSLNRALSSPLPPPHSAQRAGIAGLRWEWAVLALGAMLRIGHYLANRCLWLDETLLARNLLNRGPWELLQPLDYHQGAPVLFLWLMKAATMIGGFDERVLRLLPLVSSLIALWFFWKLASRCLDPTSARVALLIFACSRNLVYYAQEAKQYSTDVAVATILAYLGLRQLQTAENSRWDWGRLVLVGALAVFLSHPSVFILSAFCAAWLLSTAWAKRKNTLRPFCLTCAVWAGAIGANYWLFLKPLGEDVILREYWREGYLPPLRSVADARVWYQTGKSFIQYNGYIAGWEIYIAALTAISLCLGCQQRALASLYRGLIFAAAVLASLLGLYPLALRMSLFLYPVFVLMIVDGWRLLSRLQACAAAGILTTCLLAPTALSLYEFQTIPITGQDVRPLLLRLQREIRPGDRVFIHSGVEHPVRYYCQVHQFDCSDYEFATVPGAKDGAFQPSRLREMPPVDRLWYLVLERHREDADAEIPPEHWSIDQQLTAEGANLFLLSPADDASSEVPMAPDCSK